MVTCTKYQLVYTSFRIIQLKLWGKMSSVIGCLLTLVTGDRVMK
jgi:hypothetical protein